MLQEFQVTQVELVYRNKVKANDRIQVTDSQKAYKLFIALWDMNKIELCEQFMIMMLDRSMRCIGVSHISTGGISYCPVDAKIVFATALKARAVNIVLAHNHPSGSLKPSQADIALTKKLKQAGELLDLNVEDHLIVTPESYFSFADNLMI